MRQRIDYGIDLGTTNSAIARMDGSDAVILKSDDNQMDTTPSCVTYTKNKIIYTGMRAKSQGESDATASLKSLSQLKVNSFAEFKRTMGTNHEYQSSSMGREFSSEELSSEILKKLRGYVRDEVIESVVITVPAMFRQNQLDATQRAAELAGFKYCELLQEPIAASIAYGIRPDSTDGHWLVFDFGGGTFDAALMHVDEGVMKVVDTEGDNHLGGKDIDAAVVDKILIPLLKNSNDLSIILNAPLGLKLLQDELKFIAERLKITLSSRPVYEEFIEDLGPDDASANIKVTLNEFEEVSSPIFQKAINIALGLVTRSGLTKDDLNSVILVGGPTFSQTLRRMVAEQITKRVDTSVDPMTAVAKGAAIFASTRSIPDTFQVRDIAKAQLTIKYPETTVELTENLGIRVDRSKSKGLPATLFIEVIRSDKSWSTGRIQLEGDADVLEVSLSEGRVNSFEIKLSGPEGSLIACEPNTATIIQGMKIATATLPRGVGMESYNITKAKVGVWEIKGLSKNTTLPASGTDIYTTQKDIRPSNKADRLVLAFYEFDNDTDGSRALYNQPMGSVILTGEDLPALLPAGSEVQVTVRFDASRRTSYSIYLPFLDETIERIGSEDIQLTESSDDLLRSIDEAIELANKLAESVDNPVLDTGRQELKELTVLVNERGNDASAKIKARESLKKMLIAFDKLKDSAMWPKAEDELLTALGILTTMGERYGDEKSQKLILQYKNRCDVIVNEKDLKLAQNLTKELSAAAFSMMQQDIGLWMSYLKDYDNDFDATEWTDKFEARRVLNDAKKMLATNPSKSKVETAVRELWSLEPRGEIEVQERVNKELLRR